jgi:hypothetical protein
MGLIKRERFHQLVGIYFATRGNFRLEFSGRLLVSVQNGKQLQKKQ